MTILLMFMAVALLFGTVLLVRLGWANDMRTRAQRGADAAAIAAVTPLRELIVGMVQSGALPTGVGLGFLSQGVGTAPAASYAAKNKTELDFDNTPPVRPSGLLGMTTRAYVRTQDCQVTPDGGGAPQAKPCKDASGKQGPGRKGKANATAKLRTFTCVYSIIDELGPAQMTCDGEITWNRGAPPVPAIKLRKIFEIDLTDDEESVPFTGLLGGGSLPAGNAGPPPPIKGDPKCSDQGSITKRMCATYNEIRRVFEFPNGVGCFRNGDSGEHPLGRACDFMTDRIGTRTPGGLEFGDKVAQYAAANAERLGIYYVIWKQRIYNVQRASEGWRLMEDRGSLTENHFDHVHISVQPD